MDISKAWGYGAVIVPRRLFWQGFVVLDPAKHDLAPYIQQAIGIAHIGYAKLGQAPSEDQILAALTSGLAECIMRIPAPGAEGRAAVLAAAIAKLTGNRFWVVDAYEEKSGDMRTNLSTLSATTPEKARDEIDKRVLLLKMGLTLNEMKRGPGETGEA